MRDWTARAKGDLDEHAGGLLSAGTDDVLGLAQVRRVSSVALPCPQRAHARGLGGITLAGAPTLGSSRGMARSSALGAATGDDPVGCLGDGAEKYAVWLLLPVVDLVLPEL